LGTGRRSAGFSLVELMVSLVIGLVVVGAVFSAYLGSGTSSRATRALAQMTEDATVAFSVLRANVGMAGYSKPTGVKSDGSGFIRSDFSTATIEACGSRFADLTAEVGAMGCSGAGGDSIAVAFEADGATSPLGADGRPLDCLGNGIDATPAGLSVSAARFYLNKPAGAPLNALYCKGSNPGDGGQALVDNIDSMVIQYGVPTPTEVTQVAYYKPAPLTADELSRLLTVRVCVVVASSNEVLDKAVSFRNCNGDVEAAADKRLYRAFTTTIAINNRLPSGG